MLLSKKSQTKGSRLRSVLDSALRHTRSTEEHIHITVQKLCDMRSQELKKKHMESLQTTLSQHPDMMATAIISMSLVEICSKRSVWKIFFTVLELWNSDISNFAVQSLSDIELLLDHLQSTWGDEDLPIFNMILYMKSRITLWRESNYTLAMITHSISKDSVDVVKVSSRILFCQELLLRCTRHVVEKLSTSEDNKIVVGYLIKEHDKLLRATVSLLRALSPESIDISVSFRQQFDVQFEELKTLIENAGQACEYEHDDSVVPLIPRLNPLG